MQGICLDLKRESGTAWGYLSENGYIAGGCIRDAILGAPHKDIDIFFEDPSPMIEAIKKDLLMGQTVSMFKDSYWKVTDNTYSADTELLGPVQIVKMGGDSIYSILRDFDYGINKVAWSIKENRLIIDSRCGLDRYLDPVPSGYSYRNEDKIEKVVKELGGSYVPSCLNVEMTEKRLEVNLSDTMEEAMEKVELAGRTLARSIRLGRSLAPYGVDFSSDTAYVQTLLIKNVALAFSGNRPGKMAECHQYRVGDEWCGHIIRSESEARIINAEGAASMINHSIGMGEDTY